MSPKLKFHTLEYKKNTITWYAEKWEGQDFILLENPAGLKQQRRSQKENVHQPMRQCAQQEIVVIFSAFTLQNCSHHKHKNHESYLDLT